MGCDGRSDLETSDREVIMSTTERLALRVHLFQELADLSVGADHDRYAHKSHISYLAMVRVARKEAR